MMCVTLAHAREQRGVTLDLLRLRHQNGALHRLRDLIGVIGIDEGLLQIFRGAGEAREHQHAGVRFVLSRDIFLRHQIYAVPQGRDEFDLAAAVERGQRLARDVAVDIAHRRPVEVAEFPIDLTRERLELAANVGGGLHLLARRRRDLHQGDGLAIFRMQLQQPPKDRNRSGKPW